MVSQNTGLFTLNVHYHSIVVIFVAWPAPHAHAPDFAFLYMDVRRQLAGGTRCVSPAMQLSACWVLSLTGMHVAPGVHTMDVWGQ